MSAGLDGYFKITIYSIEYSEPCMAMTGAVQQATDHQVVPPVTTHARPALIVTITTTGALLIRGMSRGRIVATGTWPGL